MHQKLLKKVVQTNNPEETEKLANALGRQLTGGEILVLNSDLGGGKTTFVRGLAHGMGSSDHVASPTFMISKIYDAGKLQLHHFDFYRLPSAELMEYELAEAMSDAGNVIVIEWPAIVQSVLPAEHVIIKFDKIGDQQRRLELSYPPSMSYLAGSWA